jgi:hypothetical protein
MTFDPADDHCRPGPFLTPADLAGLYPPDVAAARSTATFPESGDGLAKLDD